MANKKALTEADVENYLKKRVKECGGKTRKLRWIGTRDAPDRFVAMPFFPALVEVKKPGESPRKTQLLEHAELRALGVRVYVIDCFEEVDEFIQEARDNRQRPKGYHGT